ncbi:MAG: nicotinate (nicotinamide) nucleotide adenylyltransferase [Elusimicrobiaceae bacterium]|jgi:nicotinate-nucleotide adenylyltransferase|nr:nicotinate (nicotinamide) nucleotide adenylyltransferase [Elusimicrobiaceae bacterium]MBT3954744.1 nicotinate (nicotinamide) nucleotide adenylyltransferase [Elusimicrobiaceae bacterium]MBT4008336.1 nicotinate (nicotinamide) nucleotide adenylyltransferase [Elusimicrobiaceae bacterium]MBT4403054.1 nicotinate (nicotinamide) nucleotide adenylyltransferase [Elusimicrobiaceae bacterium]MBT4439370.1 nicotinate (nicotinamide) nucleotide adenylyltransferase [Elusimicrobiaceae bacterium]
MKATTKQDNVLIFGGSFDPVHSAHIALLKQAIKQIKPKYSYVIPTYLSPFKKSHSIDPKHRIKMAKLVFNKISKTIIVDDIEIKNNKKTYAYQNLKYLQKKHTNAKFFLLVGSDCVDTLPKWKNFAYLKQNIIFLIGKREGFKLKKNLPFNYEVLKGNFPKISSTGVRENLEIFGKTDSHIPSPIKTYIKQRNLYNYEIHKWLEKNLAVARYTHTKYAAKLAVELAKTHNIDEQKALIASLIHDMGKSLTVEQKIKYCEKNKINFKNIKTVETYAPQLLHSHISEDMAKKIFKIKDKDILNAAKHHTLGKNKMNKLSKVIFVSDASSEDRNYPNAKKVRQLAFENLDNALKEAMRLKISYTISTGKWVSLEAIRIWNQIISQK